VIKLFTLRSFRPPDRQPDRLACNWVLISAVMAIGFHVHHLPLWLTAFAACILLWRYFIENHAWRIPGRSLRWLLLLVSAVVIFRHYGTLLGRDAGVAYLALLVALKILETRSLRDYLLVVFLLYIIVLGALLFSQSFSTGAYAVLVIVVSTHAMVRLNRPQPLAQRQTLRLVLTLLTQAVPLLLILYFLFPRIQGSLWGLPHDAFSGRTGMSEEVSPGSINQLHQDDSIAFRAEFTGAPPPPGALYWRAFVLSETDGRRWVRHRGPGDGSDGWRYQSAGPATAYTVVLEPHNQKWIPTLELPHSPAPFSHRAPGYILEANAPVQALRRFDLSSYLSYSTGPLSPYEARYNSSWPLTPSRRVQDLIHTWQQHSTDPWEAVTQVLDYFSRDPFRYTLSPPLLTGDTLDQFLFETQAGYCEFYASAFVALMRLSNIPARLVAGYQGGEWNAAGNYMIVRQSDAHAWAEVWLDPQGWVRVDPTAAIAPERIELGAGALRRLEEQGAGIGLLSVNEARRLIAPDVFRQLWLNMALRWDSLNNSWNKWVMAYGPKTQLELLKLLGVETPNWVNIVVGMFLAILLLLLVTAALWMMRSRQKPDPAVNLFHIFCRKLQRVGLERRPAEGPSDFARRVINARGDLRSPVNHITNIYITVRYGSSNSSGLSLLRKLVREFKT
jgi:transglutaminase-like putative cysteine protease